MYDMNREEARDRYYYSESRMSYHVPDVVVIHYCRQTEEPQSHAVYQISSEARSLQ